MNLEKTSRPGGKIPDSPVDPPEPIRLALLLGTAFFVTWGAGLQKAVPGVNLSRFFPFLAGLLVVYWLILGRRRFRAFPPVYNLFIFYVLAHTAVVYLVFFPGELTFGYTGVLYEQGGYTLAAPSRGIMVVRFFLFALAGYAVGALMKGRRELRFFSLAYGIGFTLSLVLGGHVWVYLSRGFARVTGGFLNPNAMAIAGLVSCFLNLAVCLGPDSSRRLRAAGILLILTALYGILAAVSRNALFSLACGGLVVVFFLPLLKKVRWSLAGGCLLLLAVALLPTNILETIPGRLTLKDVQETRWSMRRDIWTDYLKQADSYFFLGLGVDRSTEAVRETFTTDSSGPLIPHQTYLQLLVEFGVVGLVFWLAVLAVFLKRGLRLASAGPARMENAALLGLLSAFTVYGMLGSILGERSVWISLGVVAFVQNRLAGGPGDQDSAARRPAIPPGEDADGE